MENREIVAALFATAIYNKIVPDTAAQPDQRSVVIQQSVDMLIELHQLALVELANHEARQSPRAGG